MRAMHHDAKNLCWSHRLGPVGTTLLHRTRAARWEGITLQERGAAWTQHHLETRSAQNHFTAAAPTAERTLGDGQDRLPSRAERALATSDLRGPTCVLIDLDTHITRHGRERQLGVGLNLTSFAQQESAWMSLVHDVG